MLICNDCKELFQTPKIRKVSALSELGDNRYAYVPDQRIAVECCPHCNSTDVLEAVECPDCNCHFHPDALVFINGEEYGLGYDLEVCSDCYEENYFVAPEAEQEE